MKAERRDLPIQRVSDCFGKASWSLPPIPETRITWRRDQGPRIEGPGHELVLVGSGHSLIEHGRHIARVQHVRLHQFDVVSFEQHQIQQDQTQFMGLHQAEGLRRFAGQNRFAARLGSVSRT